MRQFFSFAFLSAISYLCHRVFDKSKWNTKDTAFKVDKSLPRLLPYAVCQIVRFDWNFWGQKRRKTIRMSLSRERHLAVLKRAPDAGLQANRPRFLTLRLHAVLLPLQAIMRNTSRRETRRITPVYSHIYLLIYDCSASTYSAKASRPASVMRHTVQGILPRKVFSTSM